MDAILELLKERRMKHLLIGYEMGKYRCRSPLNTPSVMTVEDHTSVISPENGCDL